MNMSRHNARCRACFLHFPTCSALQKQQAVKMCSPVLQAKILYIKVVPKLFFFICGRTHLHTHISATTALIHATFTMREMPLQANFPGMQSTMLQSNRGTNKWLLVIFSGKHALSSPKDGVFVWVVGLVLGWYFQNSWYRGSVAVDQMSDHLCYVLVDEDDVNVSTLNESFEAVFYFRHTRVFIHYFEVRLPLLVDLSDASKQKSNARILRQNEERKKSFITRLKG